MKTILKYSVLIFSVLSLGLSSCYAQTPQSTVPDFTLNTLDGEPVTLSSYRGKKVLIDFWATWCPPCRRELIELNELIAEHPRTNYEILAISVDQTEQAASDYINQMGYDDMIVLFDNKQIAQRFGVQGIPSLFLINEEGKLAWNHVGAVSKEKLIEILEL